MCLHPKCKRKFAEFAPYLPLIAMLVPQARVSKRSVEPIAEFEVVSVFSVDRGAHCDARADGKRCTTCVCVNEQTILAISGQLSAISDRIVSTGNRVSIVTSDRCFALD